jgi:hypothetical protein
MRPQLLLIALGFALAAPAVRAAEPDSPPMAVLRGSLPAGITVRLEARYLSRFWKPAISFNPALPIPIPFKDHFAQGRSVTATADAEGQYRLEFPLHVTGRLGRYSLDSAYLTFSSDGKIFNLPTWMAPSDRSSRSVGRANLAIEDVSRLRLEPFAGTTTPGTTRIHMDDGTVYTGHILGFPWDCRSA